MYSRIYALLTLLPLKWNYLTSKKKKSLQIYTSPFIKLFCLMPGNQLLIWVQKYQYYNHAWVDAGLISSRHSAPHSLPEFLSLKSISVDIFSFPPNSDKWKALRKPKILWESTSETTGTFGVLSLFEDWITVLWWIKNFDIHTPALN